MIARINEAARRERIATKKSARPLLEYFWARLEAAGDASGLCGGVRVVGMIGSLRGEERGALSDKETSAIKTTIRKNFFCVFA